MSVYPADTVILPRPVYNILHRLTGESRPDVALSLALKDLVRLRLEAARSSSASFEQKYGSTFAEFEKGWQAGEIPERHSYAVEQDYLAWEAAMTDIGSLEELASWIP